jgi:hypothetical protein
MRGRRPRRVHDAVIPFGFLFFAAFVFFSVWSWIAIGPAEAWRGQPCAADAPPTASCRSVGTATVTGTFVHSAAQTNGANTIYGVTYVGHGRIPDYSVTYTWGSSPIRMTPIPKKNQEIGVTTWQGRPVYLTFSGLTATVSTPPDKDAFLVAGFTAVAALGAVCAALIGRPLPYHRKALAALRIVDWVWFPLLLVGFVLVAVHVYAPGLVMIEAGGGIAFLAGQALRVRLVFATTDGWTSLHDDPASAPPPGARAERAPRQREHDCPVNRDDQGWVEIELTALVSQLRISRKTHPMIVPHKGFYPVDYGLADRLVVDELARKLCGIMLVDFEALSIRLVDETAPRTDDAIPGEPYPGHFSARTYDADTRKYLLELDRDLTANPPLLTAVLAHELAHIRLRGNPERTIAARRLEQRADMVVIAYGLGLFGGNVRLNQDPDGLPDASPTSLGGLTPEMYGYALACASWLRGEEEPDWAGSLDSPVRDELARSLRYLAAHAGGGGLPTMTMARD